MVARAQSPLIRAIDDLVASDKIDRFPLEIEVIPYLTDAFGSTPDEAVETLREWERRKGRG